MPDSLKAQIAALQRYAWDGTRYQHGELIIRANVLAIFDGSAGEGETSLAKRIAEKVIEAVQVASMIPQEAFGQWREFFDEACIEDVIAKELTAAALAGHETPPQEP